MPTLNLGQVCSIATTFAGGRLDWTLSEASLYANLALEQVAVAAGVYHMPLEAIAVSSTTSGENRIALPADFDFPKAVTLYQGSNSTATTSRQTTSIPLVQREADWVDGKQGLTLGGVPANYVLYGTWLELFPSPNSAYSLQLRYTSRQGTLTDSSSTPALSEQWFQAWTYKTVELLEASRNNAEGELLARNRYLSYVATLRTDLGKKQQDAQSMALRKGWRGWTG